MNGRTPTRNPIADRTAIVLGFGLFLVPYGGGPFGFISGSDQHTAAWGLLLLVQTTFFLSVALGCAGMRLSARQGDGHQWKTAGTVGYVIAALIGLTTQPLLAGMSVQDETVVRVALSATTGLLYAPPFTFWVDRLRNLGKTSSHCGLTGVLILCYLLCPAVVAACSLLPIPYAYSVIQLACAVASASIQTFCFHYSQDTRSPESSRGRPDNPLPYRITPYSTALLVCLGFSWGISDGAALYGLASGSVNGTELSLVIAFVALLATETVIWARKRGHGDIRFGTVVRLAIVVCGAVLAGLALVYAKRPVLLYPLCNLVMIAGEVALVIFTVDVCNEQGRPVTPVFTLNYALFMGTGCLSSAFFFVVHTLMEDQTAWMVTGTVAVWAVLAVIPFLPSRSSNAVVLTSKTLPEDEGYEANVAIRRDLMAQRYSLSEGEAAVLELLLKGKRREEIAGELNLSPWTVKARTSSIYRKCEVHSFKELIQLISDD